MNLTSRNVDTTIHDLTPVQALEEILRLFRISRREQISVFVRRGEGRDYLQRVRTELSRMRKGYRDNDQRVPFFGFKITGPFRINADGIAKEGYAINYRITKLQQVKSFMQHEELA